MPGEEPTAGILGSTEALLVGSSGRLKVLVTGPYGRVGPLSGAGPEIGEVFFERGSLFVDSPTESCKRVPLGLWL